jgi:hypothetical protein
MPFPRELVAKPCQKVDMHISPPIYRLSNCLDPTKYGDKPATGMQIVHGCHIKDETPNRDQIVTSAASDR